MTVNVRHQRRDRPALRHARGLGEGPTLRQHPGTYPQTQQPDHHAIADPAADESQKQVLVETPVVVLEVQVHHLPCLIATYGTVRHCGSHRYSAPCGFSRLGFSLSLRARLAWLPHRAIESQLPTFHVGA